MYFYYIIFIPMYVEIILKLKTRKQKVGHFLDCQKSRDSIIFVCSFRQRLELMREMYQNEAETSPSSPDGGQDRHSGVDPFYDRHTVPLAIPR
jgi:hypothetical protein